MQLPDIDFDNFIFDEMSNTENNRANEGNVSTQNQNLNQNDRNIQPQNLNDRNNTQRNDDDRNFLPNDLFFMSKVAPNFPRAYDGDPLQLDSFINKINLIKNRLPTNFETTFVDFIYSKLEGRALEAVPPQPTNIEQIIEALKSKIKPENSEVVAGRMTALRVQNNNYNDFMKEAETLAESFRRALIIEGIPQSKAQQMTVHKTIDLCVSATRSPFIRSVLTAQKLIFTEPQQALAELVFQNHCC